ncbi:MAG TPA: hypothetical protein VFC19_06515 [Candidatus Limnocylindrales bacterium]|nr:hypothetical protein [Candidatus Limnocylindrales bacterium]
MAGFADVGIYHTAQDTFVAARMSDTGRANVVSVAIPGGTAVQMTGPRDWPAWEPATSQDEGIRQLAKFFGPSPGRRRGTCVLVTPQTSADLGFVVLDRSGPMLKVLLTTLAAGFGPASLNATNPDNIFLVHGFLRGDVALPEGIEFLNAALVNKYLAQELGRPATPTEVALFAASCAHRPGMFEHLVGNGNVFSIGDVEVLISLWQKRTMLIVAQPPNIAPNFPSSLVYSLEKTPNTPPAADPATRIGYMKVIRDCMSQIPSQAYKIGLVMLCRDYQMVLKIGRPDDDVPQHVLFAPD